MEIAKAEGVSCSSVSESIKKGLTVVYVAGNYVSTVWIYSATAQKYIRDQRQFKQERNVDYASSHTIMA